MRHMWIEVHEPLSEFLVTGDYMRLMWALYEGATRLEIRSFDHKSCHEVVNPDLELLNALYQRTYFKL